MFFCAPKVNVFWSVNLLSLEVFYAEAFVLFFHKEVCPSNCMPGACTTSPVAGPPLRVGTLLPIGFGGTCPRGTDGPPQMAPPFPFWWPAPDDRVGVAAFCLAFPFCFGCLEGGDGSANACNGHEAAQKDPTGMSFGSDFTEHLCRSILRGD